MRDFHTRHKDEGEQDGPGAGHAELGRQVDAERDGAGWRKASGERKRRRNSLGGVGGRQEERGKGKRPPPSGEKKPEDPQCCGFLVFPPFIPAPAPSPLTLSLPSPVSSHVLPYLVRPSSLTGHLSLAVCLSSPSLLPPTPDCGVSGARAGRGSAAGKDIRYHHPPREGPETRALLLAPRLKFPSPVPLPLQHPSDLLPSGPLWPAIQPQASPGLRAMSCPLQVALVRHPGRASTTHLTLPLPLISP